MGDELLDIVNADDVVVGQVFRKKWYENKTNDTFIRVVNIYLFNSKDQILVPKRSLDRDIFPGCYDFSCGEHIMSGEGYYAAAIRGLKEELGITGVNLEFMKKFTPKDGFNVCMEVYKLVYDKKIIKYDKQGIEGLLWMNLKEISQMVKEHPEKFKGHYSMVIEKLKNLNFI